MTGESVRSDAAVTATAGRILTYGGQPAVTYYFSTSGGQTENIEFSFVGALSKPWLVSVPDPYDSQSPYHRWTVRTSAAHLDSALGAPGAFKRVKILKRGVSPRVVRARVIGTRGSKTLSGPRIRTALGLRDTWFTFVRVSTSARHRARRGRPAGGRFVAGARGQLLARAEAPGGRGGAPQRQPLARVGRVHTTASGRYRVEVERAGTYRVRSGSVAGPSVRVR